MAKEYLGDSVYADIDEHGYLVLATENGYEDDPRNVIYFEPEVLSSLLRFLEVNYNVKVTRKQDEQKENKIESQRASL